METQPLLPSRGVSRSRLALLKTAVVSVVLVAAIAALLSYSGSLWRSRSVHSPVRGPSFDGDGRPGRLPVMGYNTWNAYYCDINEDKILKTARLMKSLGLLDLGYNYVNVDDCYSEKQRNSNGDIVEDPEKFPSGMRTLTDKIHDMGFKAGIYSDSGWFTCQIYPGSFQNEDRDIKLFRDNWNFDLLKYDNCAIPFDNVIKEGMVGKFQRMADAIDNLSKNTGRPPILFSLCQWGEEQPWLWAKKISQTWRTTEDIGANWRSVMDILNRNSFITWANDFYSHNDMDMLEVGNGELSYEEAKTHFTAWALLKSPLLVGTDLPSASEETLSILKNEEIIAINQDPVVGASISPFRWGINPDWTYNATHPAQFWSGESENGTVIMLLNTLDEPADLTFNLTESPWLRAGRQYSVRDLWTHTDNDTAVRTFTAHAVPAHGVVALLLRDAGDEPEGLWPPCMRLNWCMAENGTRYDGRDFMEL
ncbi:glycoside hydrolase family 27 protein [Daedalea quercina L-15889]|uniref:Alpha-galactosidase n=1 Tax=Daedalea quercina L-15889 TaxID=1314783 RepID=A0A165QYW5_9APHY|nr:glycoside hydrolase family 27 protein [Daedalea quercina L-15889]